MNNPTVLSDEEEINALFPVRAVNDVPELTDRDFPGLTPQAARQAFEALAVRCGWDLAQAHGDGVTRWLDPMTRDLYLAWLEGRASANADHISIPAFLAELDMDQLYRCQELTQSRIDAIKDAGRVTVWEVSDDMMNYFGTDDYPSALDALARISRQQFDKTGKPENFHLCQRRIFQAELIDYLARWP